MSVEEVWWKYESQAVQGNFVKLPKDAVILGSCPACEDDDRVYVDYLRPALEAEAKMLDATQTDWLEGGVEEFSTLYKEAVAARSNS